MTTIAWDGHTIAADGMGVWGGTSYNTHKLRLVQRTLRDLWVFGLAGDAPHCQALFEYWEGLRLEAPIPTADTGLNALCVELMTGNCWFATDARLVWTPVRGNFAIGSGAEYALGAMHAGASALLAVKIAGQLDVNTGTWGQYVSVHMPAVLNYREAP